MKRFFRKCPPRLALGFLLGAGVVLTGLIGWLWRQERLNQSLVTAVEKRDILAVTTLLQHGANANFTYEKPSIKALWNNIQRLWSREETAGRSVLCIALDRGNIETVYALLDHGATISGHNDDLSNTPYLIMAVDRPNVEIALILRMLACGAGVNIIDRYGRSALIAATENNRMDLVSLLLDHGADPNATIGHYGPVTPLIEAVRNHNIPMARRLLQSGASVNVTSPRMPSLLALAKGDAPLARLLKQAGAK